MNIIAKVKVRWRHFWAGWLPARGREVLLAEQARLAAALAAERAENARLRAYVEGMQAALRTGRQVKIYNAPAKAARKEHDEDGV